MTAKKSRTKSKRSRGKKGDKNDECTIPGPVPSEALSRLKVRPDPKHEELHVRNYMADQAHDERVIHLEKVATERLFSGKYEVWDVHTDKHRWWVLTNPTNLYSQEHFPSLDYILSFHIGLALRIAAQSEKQAAAGSAEHQRFLGPWRRWEQTVQAIDLAEEAEDFQAIGMRCRECLIEFVQGAADVTMLQDGEEAPKRSDFVHWSDIIARSTASGSSATEVRSYLRTIAKTIWTYVNWLTHAKSAVRADAQLALDGTAHALTTFGTILLRYEHGAPERCPECSSYQVVIRVEPVGSPLAQAASACVRCGWTSEPAP